nr:hypothetical protein [Tanacetum cinerariifolium]
CGGVVGHHCHQGAGAWLLCATEYSHPCENRGVHPHRDSAVQRAVRLRCAFGACGAGAGDQHGRLSECAAPVLATAQTGPLSTATRLAGVSHQVAGVCGGHVGGAVGPDVYHAGLV